MTDDFGVWQFFENGKILRSEGYALDDSSRALIVYLLYQKPDKAKICLDYIERSIKDSKLVGFWDENRKPIVYPSSEDAHALAVWALSYAIANNFEKEKSQELLSKIDIGLLENSQYIRTQCYALIAHNLLKNTEKADTLAQKIASRFDEELQWFENKLTYANSIIPYALLTYLQEITPSEPKKYEEIVKKSFQTLEKYMRIGVIPGPVGSNKWQEIGEVLRDIYGQQPIDAGFMVLFLVKAYAYFKDDQYKKAADEWMEWFHGNNIMKANLITPEYACSDWIKEQGISTNYGSESTIIYLWAQQVYNTLYE